jgi:hypothetical protein
MELDVVHPLHQAAIEIALPRVSKRPAMPHMELFLSVKGVSGLDGAGPGWAAQSAFRKGKAADHGIEAELGAHARRPAAPRPQRGPDRRERRHRAGQRGRIGGRHQQAGFAIDHQLGVAAHPVAITGRPEAIASSRVLEMPSASEGSTKTFMPLFISGMLDARRPSRRAVRAART